jgi:hypothetical protein
VRAAEAEPIGLAALNQTRRCAGGAHQAMVLGAT